MGTQSKCSPGCFSFMGGKSDPLPKANTKAFGLDVAKQVRTFFPETTPLKNCRKLAEKYGVAGIYCKDESFRQGQQAFKVNGAAYAMAMWLAKYRLSLDDLSTVSSMSDLKTKLDEKYGDEKVTFVTCTDGNHGRAVAFGAKLTGQKAIVYMPKGSAQARVDHITGHGGDCTVTDMNYDATVNYAFEMEKKHGWTLLQDTTGPNYTEIPTWIMQGYTALIDEAMEQLGEKRPSHVILQVGWIQILRF